jgi:hypothetical protein
MGRLLGSVACRSYCALCRIVFSWLGQMVLCAHGKKVAQAIRGWTCKRPYLLFHTSFGVSLEESKAIGALFHVLCAFSR